MTQAIAFPVARPALSYWAASEPVAPPSGRVVAAVLQFGDLWESRADGTTLIRFSPLRLEQNDMALILGAERDRAQDISLIWDDRDEQLLQVLDAAPLRPPAAPASGPTGNAYADARMRGYPRYMPQSEAEAARAA